MAKNEEIITMTEEDISVENADIIRFSKTYMFEGTSIGEVNMAGLEDMTANDMIQVNKILNARGNVTIFPEGSLEYALLIAAKATKLPVEFYKSLAPRDAITIKNKVTNFFFGEE